ncbi:MAG: hypothetical protein Q9222_003375 [Ikaeria aurantiellina]
MALAPKPSIAFRSLLHRHSFIRVSTRSFHGSPHHAGSPLLNLAGLSTSRECQFLSKERGIPRTEFSPHLELIKSSEVTPFRANQSTDGAATAIAIGDSPVIAYLTKEVENTKAALVKVKEAERALRRRLHKTEREAEWLLTATVALVLYLAFSEEIKKSWRGFTTSFHGSPWQQDTSLVQALPPRAHRTETVIPDVPLQRSSPPVADMQATPISDPIVHRSQPRFARYFWAT